MKKALARYGVTHRLSTSYHPKTSGQVENENRGVKRILEKTVGKNQKEWSDKLDEALWAFCMASKTAIGTMPFRMVYGKACHLPVELEHRKLKKVKEFKCGDQVLVYNSHLKLFPGKLRSRWVGPYTVKAAFPHGAFELVDHEGRA
ncbi:uncharacterized protein LOC143635478 [Bidens hawaiensis]|uniref:uncharacterized protein LOC143635478 n=1 Tax=Bidens hawaiensis TaxID=980011 RepID=UPI00404B90B5